MIYPLRVVLATLSCALLGCGRSGAPAVSSTGDIPHLRIAKDERRLGVAFPDWKFPTSFPVTTKWHPKLGTYDFVVARFAPDAAGSLVWRFDRFVKSTDWISRVETQEFTLPYGEAKTFTLFEISSATAYYHPTVSPEL